MLKDRICKYCGKEFKNIEGRIFSNHVRWCDKNPKDKSIGINKIKQTLRNFYDEKIGKLIDFEVKCNKCGKSFHIKEYELKFSPDRIYYCSRSCANSHILSNETKEKISKSLLKYYNVPEKHCLYCKTNITMTKRSKFCSNNCKTLYKWEKILNKAVNDVEREKILIRKYKSECTFKFNILDYPDEFDFELIKKYGWYKPKNYGNNLNGVSRDHIYSVMDGYTNNIDPAIISHPANCRLIRHNENASKGRKSFITLNDLLEKIKQWDEKYKKEI